MVTGAMTSDAKTCPDLETMAAFLEGRMTTNLLDRVGSSAFLAAAARA